MPTTAYICPLWQRWFYIPKRLDTTPTKKARPVLTHLLEKQNGVSYSTRWYRIYGCSSDHNQKDLQLRQTQIAPTLRNRRVIVKTPSWTKHYLRNTTDAVSCSTKNGGAVREDDDDTFDIPPIDFSEDDSVDHEDDAPRTHWVSLKTHRGPEDVQVYNKRQLMLEFRSILSLQQFCGF
jgi:hypothetical protein